MCFYFVKMSPYCTSPTFIAHHCLFQQVMQNCKLKKTVGQNPNPRKCENAKKITSRKSEVAKNGPKKSKTNIHVPVPPPVKNMQKCRNPPPQNADMERVLARMRSDCEGEWECELWVWLRGGWRTFVHQGGNNYPNKNVKVFQCFFYTYVHGWVGSSQKRVLWIFFEPTVIFILEENILRLTSDSPKIWQN